MAPETGNTGEVCAGCDSVAAAHPFAGVGKDENGATVQKPVCFLCWKDPGHRKHPLKMHFFEKWQGAAAVEASEKNILVEKPS